MTFTEAAVEVLRLVGKPLHYKKITEVAIERNLLSHVGKTPEVTMSSRLATMVKRDRGEAPIIKVKPGVFGLREFNEEQLADLSGDVDELPEVEVESEQDKAQDVREIAAEVVSPAPSSEPRKPMPGADVFPEEEDDDEPILGGEEDEDEDDDAAEGDEPLRADAQPGAESRSSRRRRKRRRRGTADEPAEAEPRAGRDAREPREVREPRESRDAREPREVREPRESRDAREPVRGRDVRREDRALREERRRERDDRREREEPLDLNREPGDGDLLGKDLADAVASVLAQGGPRGMSALRIADQLVRRGRLQGDPNALVPTLMAAVRADVARKRGEQTRARFRLEAGSIVLTDFLLPQEVLRAEQDVLRAAERQRERTRRAFLRRLSELPGAGMAELIATWLNAEGVVGLRAVRRPGAGVGELHLAGTLRRGADEIRLAIIVYREARELGRERVIEARGSLHYYGNASMAWLIGFGSVMSGAREEASAPAAGPITLYDGLALAAAMERQGVGLAVQAVSISALDYELLDALRGQVPRELESERGREREQPERGRERRERDRGERDRGERERGERERGERERPRLSLELPRASLVEELELDPELLEEELEDDPTLDEGDEVIEAALEEASPIAAGGEPDQAEAREGSRRRRRRRRRKGRGAEAASTSAELVGAELGEGEELESDDEDEEDAEPAALSLRDAEPSQEPEAERQERAFEHDADDEGDAELREEREADLDDEDDPSARYADDAEDLDEDADSLDDDLGGLDDEDDREQGPGELAAASPAQARIGGEDARDDASEAPSTPDGELTHEAGSPGEDLRAEAPEATSPLDPVPSPDEPDERDERDLFREQRGHG